MIGTRRAIGAVLAIAVLATACSRSLAGDAGPAVAFGVTPPVSASGAPTAIVDPAPPSSTALRSGTSPAPVPSSAVPTAGSAAPSSGPPVKWVLPEPSTAARKNNQYGNRIAAVGQSFALTFTQTKERALLFIVDSIKLDGACDDTDAKPANGHFLLITMRVQLGNVTGDELDQGSIGFTASDWTAFDSKNVAQVGTDSIGNDCLSTSLIPFASDMDSGEIYKGKVALDVSATKGTVVLMSGVSGGWVYNYG